MNMLHSPDWWHAQRIPYLYRLNPEYYRLIVLCSGVGGSYDQKVEEARQEALRRAHPFARMEIYHPPIFQWQQVPYEA